MRFLKFISLSVMLLFSALIQASYMDNRDLTSETKRIQRLLGQLDFAQQANNNNSDRATTIAVLAGIAATGLAVTTIGSHTYYPYYRPYHRPYHHKYYNKRYYYRHRNNAAVAVGATMAAAGIIGAIAVAASEDSKVQESQQQQIQKEITTIISNLVMTDEDFLLENATLSDQISNNSARQSSEIHRSYSNSLLGLETRIKTRLENFSKETNNLTLQKEKISSETEATYLSNIDKISDPDTGKEGVKELKKFNKELKSREKSSLKEIDKKIKNIVKTYNKSQKNFEDQIRTEKSQVDSELQKSLSDLKDISRKEKDELMLKYINLYSQRLAS